MDRTPKFSDSLSCFPGGCIDLYHPQRSTLLIKAPIGWGSGAKGAEPSQGIIG